MPQLRTDRARPHSYPAATPLFHPGRFAGRAKKERRRRGAAETLPNPARRNGLFSEPGRVTGQDCCKLLRQLAAAENGKARCRQQTGPATAQLPRRNTPFPPGKVRRKGEEGGEAAKGSSGNTSEPRSPQRSFPPWEARKRCRRRRRRRREKRREKAVTPPSVLPTFPTGRRQPGNQEGSRQRREAAATHPLTLLQHPFSAPGDLRKGGTEEGKAEGSSCNASDNPPQHPFSAPGGSRRRETANVESTAKRPQKEARRG